MSNIDIGDVATWVASLVTVASLAYAVQQSRSARHAEEQNRKLAATNTQLLEDQRKLLEKNWVDSHFGAIRAWAREITEAIAEAIHLPDEIDCDPRQIHILSRLSSSIDSGRWYFPNQGSEKHGTDKAPAYRGVRQPVLDAVVSAYNCLKNERDGAKRRVELVKIQRLFVSHVQAVIDPRTREQEIISMMKSWAESERLRTTL